MLKQFLKHNQLFRTVFAIPLAGYGFVRYANLTWDAEFLAAYSAAMARPELWQAEADRRGIRTVLLFHRWPNRHALIQFLLRDPRWTWVYFDETAIIFVRREGNEALIARARDRFAAAAPESIEERMPISIARPAPLKPPIGWSSPSIAAVGSVVGRPSRSSAQPSGRVRPFCW